MHVGMKLENKFHKSREAYVIKCIRCVYGKF